jgi:hypothetical protein
MKIEFNMNTKIPNYQSQIEEQPDLPHLPISFMNQDMELDEEMNINTDMEMDNMDVNMDNMEMDMDNMDMDNMDNMDVNMDNSKTNNLFNVDLAKRDQYLLKIEDEIQLRRKFLMEKQNKLEKLSRQNHFLETIKEDYEKYHNYIVEQKEGQIRAMNSIKQYVEDLIVSGKLTDQDIRQAKDDQREITNEVKKIREKINDIIGV